MALRSQGTWLYLFISAQAVFSLAFFAIRATRLAVEHAPPVLAGVRHSNIICDSCKKHGIMGMRWKCKVCFDYDLCTQCYMNNKHDLGHAFERYETAHSQP